MLGVAWLSIAASTVAAAHESPQNFAVSLSASPSPSDPLLFTFSATVLSGTPTGYDWSFGDGTFWNGSGSAYAEPVHRYTAAGVYRVSLIAFESNVSATSSLSVTAVAPTLVVSIHVQNSSGRAPLTVTFAGTVVGGSGTYSAFLWEFGDGSVGSGLDISYTYTRPGAFLAVLNVTDSTGGRASAETRVNVSGTVTGSSSSSTLRELGAVAPWIGLGLLVGVALAAGPWMLRRISIRRRPPAPNPEPSAGPSAAEPAATPVPNGVGAVEPVAPAAAAPTRVEPVAEPPAEPVPSKVAIDPGAMRVSQRIVLHLASLGTLGPDEVAPVGFTQLGMAGSLGVRQNALTNVLRRLAAAGVVADELQHVRGQPRRLKVYRLTPRGQELAKELRRSAPPSAFGNRDGG